MSPGSAGLARAYEQAVYVAELAEGLVEFRLHRQPRGPAPAFPLAIITAWNPGTQRPSAARNEEANRELEAALQAAGWSYRPACGRSEDGVHAEPSFAVLRIEPAAAIALARRFRQAALFYWDGKKPALLWCDKA